MHDVQPFWHVWFHPVWRSVVCVGSRLSCQTNFYYSDGLVFLTPRKCGWISPAFNGHCLSFISPTVSAAARVLTVSEETERTMRVTWQPAPGNVVNYRVSYKPQGETRQMASKAPGGTNTLVLRRLQPQTPYDITVVPVYKFGDGRQRQGEGTTCKLIADIWQLEVRQKLLRLRLNVNMFILFVV